MNTWFTRVSPIFTLLILIALFALGFIIFWYLLIFGIIAWLTFFAIGYIRSKCMPTSSLKHNQTPHKGRIIEHQD